MVFFGTSKVVARWVGRLLADGTAAWRIGRRDRGQAQDALLRQQRLTGKHIARRTGVSVPLSARARSANAVVLPNTTLPACAQPRQARWVVCAIGGVMSSRRRIFVSKVPCAIAGFGPCPEGTDRRKPV